jgi:hypothetical protein
LPCSVITHDFPVAIRVEKNLPSERMLVQETEPQHQKLHTMKPHRGTLILVLGILGLVVCSPLGIVAWVMGSGDLKEIDAGTMDPAGRGSTQAGKICGMIATILMIIGVVIVILVMALGGMAALHAKH